MTTHAEARADQFAELMARTGYDPTDELRHALTQEFANCSEADAEADAEDGAMDSVGHFLDALQYAAGRLLLEDPA